MLFYLGTLVVVVAIGELLGGRERSNTAKIRDVWQALGFRTREGKYPVKINKDRSDKHLIYRLQAGQCAEEVFLMQPYLNSYLQAETDVWVDNGEVHIKVMAEKLPDRVPYEKLIPPEKDEEGNKIILPIPVGMSREGFLWADLAKLPHIAVGGETFGGKTM